MVFASFLAAAALAALSQNADALPAATTIPIAFTHSIDANHAHAGDQVTARTTQIVKLGDGTTIRAGAQVIGHVVADAPFAYDPTPYAKQKHSQLAIHFDRLVDQGRQIPLSVYVRALADPVTSANAARPTSADDTLTTLTQIGGDQMTPSQAEVVSRDGDVVAYQRRGGVVAHLIAAQGNSPEGCDGSETEQAVKIFSASACGIYGFADVSLVEAGRRGASGTFILESRRLAPKIWANSNALLEVMAPESSVASR